MLTFELMLKSHTISYYSERIIWNRCKGTQPREAYNIPRSINLCVHRIVNSGEVVKKMTLEKSCQILFSSGLIWKQQVQWHCWPWKGIWKMMSNTHRKPMCCSLNCFDVFSYCISTEHWFKLFGIEQLGGWIDLT